MGQAKRNKDMGKTSRKLRFLKLLRLITGKYSERQIREFAERRKL